MGTDRERGPATVIARIARVGTSDTENDQSGSGDQQDEADEHGPQIVRADRLDSALTWCGASTRSIVRGASGAVRLAVVS
jgi:hypothetical protein